MEKYTPLTCIKLERGGIKFVTLVDGGSNVSCVTLGLLKALKLTHLIEYKTIKAKSWNDQACTFMGKINFSFNIGKFNFNFNFYVADKLETGTAGILGIDFLKHAEATLVYSLDGVKLSIKKDKISISLVKASTKLSKLNMLQIYAAKAEEMQHQYMSRNCDTIKLEPLLGKIIRIALPEYDWPKQAHIESCEPKAGVLIDSQVITVHKYTPTLKAKHSKSCSPTKCVSFCPKSPYHYAFAFAYNSTSSPIYLHSDTKLAVVEPEWDQHALRVSFNKALNTVIQDIQRVVGEEKVHSKPKYSQIDTSSTLNVRECTSKKCKYHREISNENTNSVNYLHLDPVKDKKEYQEAYSKLHNPKISLTERVDRVTELLKTKYSHIHPIAKQYLIKYPEIVNLDDVPFVGCRTIKHKIIYKGPIYFTKQYRTPQVMDSQILEEVDRLLREGLIEPSDSPFSNCYLPVVKFDPTTQKYKIRLCLDLRKLNAGLEIDRLPIGDTQQLLNMLNGAKYLTVLDASSGYLQVDLDEPSKRYTAFRIGNRAFQWRKMCFGLAGAPSSWSRLMQLTLSGLKGVYVYMDDILLFSSSLDEHERILNEVFKRLSFHGIEIALRKCKFVASEVEYLGFLVTAEGLKPQEKRLKTLLDLPLPKTLTEARSLISAFSFYRRFIRNFSTIAHPLIQLTKGHSGKGSRISISPDEECLNALNELKNILQRRVCLKYPDFSRSFQISTDASYKGIGAVLSQRDGSGHQRPLAFISRTLTLSETRYPVVELECLSIIFALKQFKHIILGYEIELITDHLPLVYLFKNSDPSSRLYRYQLVLLEFNIKGIKHLAGQDNKVCDYLSRWSFREDELGDPVVSYTLTSPLSQDIPPNFQYDCADELENIEKSLVIFASDARNLTFNNHIKELANCKEIQDFYSPRKAVTSDIPVSSKESSPTLGQVIYKTFGNVCYAMCITNIFEKPKSIKEKQSLMKIIYENEILTQEGFKFLVRNDKTTLRDFYFMVCLEHILNNMDFTNISKVQIIWPKSVLESSKRIYHMADLLKHFSFALWQNQIPCTIIGQSKVNYGEKDALMAVLSIPEAKASPVDLFTLETEIIKKAQNSDPVLGDTIKEMVASSLLSHNQYILVNDVLYISDLNETRGLIKKLCIPTSLIPTVIQIYHDRNHHPGYIKTLLDCRSQCHWPGMAKDINHHISQCTICIRAKWSNNKQVIPGHLVIPPRAGHTWAIDILGSLPKSGFYSKILVSICTFSRFTRAVPLTTGAAVEVIKRLEDLFHVYGVPEVLVSDRAGAFTGNEFEEYFKYRNIHHHRTTPYSPRSNALAERSVRNVLSILRILCQDKPKNWHSYLPTLCGAINEGFHTSLRERPFFLFFSRDPTPSFSILRDSSINCNSDERYLIAKYSYELASKVLESEQRQRDEKVNSGNTITYNVGDIVYLQRRFVNEKAHKLKYPYEGPYRITDISGNTVVVKSLASNKEKRASMRDLKIYKGSLLTKNDNKNVDKAFPIHQAIPFDILDQTDQVHKGEDTTIRSGYKLRSRVKK